MFCAWIDMRDWWQAEKSVTGCKIWHITWFGVPNCIEHKSNGLILEIKKKQLNESSLKQSLSVSGASTVYLSSPLLWWGMKTVNMLQISQNSQVQQLCGWTQECMCAAAEAATAGAAAAALRLLSIRVNYSQHVRARAFLTVLHSCQEAVSGGVGDMTDQGRPHECVFKKTWLNPSASEGQSVNPFLT